MSAPPPYGNNGQAGAINQPNVPFSNPQSKIELKIACRYQFFLFFLCWFWVIGNQFLLTFTLHPKSFNPFKIDKYFWWKFMDCFNTRKSFLVKVYVSKLLHFNAKWSNYLILFLTLFSLHFFFSEIWWIWMYFRSLIHVT